MDVRVPPVWISIAGEGGLYPVTAIPATGKESQAATEATDVRKPGEPVDYRHYVYQRPDPRPDSCAAQDSDSVGILPAQPVARTPTLWVVVGLALVLVLCWTGCNEVRAAFGGRPAKGVPPFGDRVYAVVCLAAVLIPYAYVAWIWCIPLHAFSAAEQVSVSKRPWYWAVEYLVWLPPGIAALLAYFSKGMKRRKGEANTAVGEEPGNESKFAIPWQLIVISCVLLPVALVIYLEHKYWYEFVSRPPDVFFLYERAINVANGLSPVVPAVLLGSAFYFWGYVQLKRIAIRAQWDGVDPFPGKPWADPAARWLEQIDKCRGRLDRDLARPWEAVAVRWNLLVWCVLWFVLCRIAFHFTPAAERLGIEIALFLAMAVLSMLAVAGWMHARKLWGSVRELLRFLGQLPMCDAFKNVPATVSGVFGPYLSYARNGQNQFLFSRRQHHHLVEDAYGRMAELLADKDLPRRDGDAHPYVRALCVLKPAFARQLRSSEVDCKVLSVTARDCLKALAVLWDQPEYPARTSDTASGSPDAEATARLKAAVSESQTATLEHLDVFGRVVRGSLETLVSVFGGADPPARAAEKTLVDPQVDAVVAAWRKRAEDFVALEATIYLSHYCAQMRNLTIFLSSVPLLLLFAASSYTFQPQRLWLLLAGGMIPVVAGTVIRMLFIAERDEVMSRIQKTTPDRIDLRWGFLSHLAIFAAPLIALVVTVSGTASDLVHIFLDPLLEILR